MINMIVDRVEGHQPCPKPVNLFFCDFYMRYFAKVRKVTGNSISPKVMVLAHN